MVPCARRADDVEDEGRHGIEADAPLRLLGIDSPLKGCQPRAS